jgi:hypothetical protein
MTKSKDGVYYMGIIIFNHLPHTLRELSNDFKNFKSAIKIYFQTTLFTLQMNNLNGQ